MKKICFVVTMLLCTVVSCTTFNRLTSAEYMHIMVYDYDNNMVQGMSFYIDDKKVGESDVYGRLLVDFSVSHDNEIHKLRGEKTGYMAIEDNIRYTTSGVLYYKTGTSDQYISIAEEQYDSGNYKEALVNIQRAENIESADDILYLKGLILKGLGKKAEAVEVIKNVKHKHEGLIKEIEQ